MSVLIWEIFLFILYVAQVSRAFNRKSFFDRNNDVVRDFVNFVEWSFEWVDVEWRALIKGIFVSNDVTYRFFCEEIIHREEAWGGCKWAIIEADEILC